MDSSTAATTRTDHPECQAGPQGVVITSPTGSEAAKSSRGTPTDSDAPQGSVAKPVGKIKGPEEIRRLRKGDLNLWNPELEVEADLEHIVTQINQRAERVVVPKYGIPVPTGSNAYDTTETLFSHIEEIIAEQTLLSKQISSLLTYWTISTWFADAFLRQSSKPTASS